MNCDAGARTTGIGATYPSGFSRLGESGSIPIFRDPRGASTRVEASWSCDLGRLGLLLSRAMYGASKHYQKIGRDKRLYRTDH